ncbi:MAG TPA: hypothetical protein VHX88_14425 [Solirubrobacteraceae bacterium]|nr:hypothetical protein [Solirubrobacteraceae bacterium]
MRAPSPPPVAAVAAALIGPALLLTGCGGSTAPAAAGGQGSSGLPSSGALLRLSACMRADGVPGFPDPDARGVIELSPSSGVNADSPQFQAASQRCQRYAPTGTAPSPRQQAKISTALAFTACMRAHGEPDFPGPIADGQVMLAEPKGTLDPGSPIFQAAQKACASVAPGAAGGSVSRSAP